MVYTAQEFLDLLSWKLHRILEQEGVSELHWAFMQRALLNGGDVPFSVIRRATGESIDKVRRAAKFLEEANVGKVEVNPKDRRGRFFVLTKLGRRRTLHVNDAFQAELLRSVGAREIFSNRVSKFTRHMWLASCYLASGDLADEELIDSRSHNRASILDYSLRYVEADAEPKRIFIDPEADHENVPF